MQLTRLLFLVISTATPIHAGIAVIRCPWNPCNGDRTFAATAAVRICADLITDIMPQFHAVSGLEKKDLLNFYMNTARVTCAQIGGEVDRKCSWRPRAPSLGSSKLSCT